MPKNSEYNPRGAAGYNVRADVAAQHSGVDFWQIESTCHNQHSRQGGNWEPGRPTAAAAMVSIPEGSVPAGLADTSWSIDSDAPQLPGEADLAVKLRFEKRLVAGEDHKMVELSWRLSIRGVCPGG